MPQKHNFRNKSRKTSVHASKQDTVPDGEESQVLKAFRGYASILDAKHDRYERIVKLSRDITIEAKRIIFLLHTIDGRKNNRDTVLKEAEVRLNKVITINFKNVAKELIGQDVYQYRGAYSPGLQEFIEAYTYMEYFKLAENSESSESMSDWFDLQQKMQYDDKSDIPLEEVDAIAEKDNTDKTEVCYNFFVDPTEYILGLADLTGELMRRCINSLGSGETDTCFDTCQVLQKFYSGYVSLNALRVRDLSRKIVTMRQSVLKAENVCYNVKVRGSEAAKWGAIDSKPQEDIDEGFF